MKCFFAVLCLVLVSATVGQVCRGIRGQGFVADPTNCHGWVRCTREVADSCGLCEWGMVFDPTPEIPGCNYATENCGDRPVNPDALGLSDPECPAGGAAVTKHVMPTVLVPKRF